MKIEQHTGQINVDKKIITLLSKSTYIKSFSNAMREMVSNSYDADSLSVRINIDTELANISIEDDGNGMTLDEFNHFCIIAGQKRDINYSRKYQRKRIGHFGIGFLSIFPFCKKLKIISTVENSDELLTAVIPTEEYFKDDSDNDIQSIKFPIEIIKNESIKTQHFTVFQFIDPTQYLKQYFTKEVSRKRATIKKFDPFEKFKWELEEDLPISYKSESKYSKILNYDEPIGINVYFNNIQLYRHNLCENILVNKSFSFSDINIKLLITTDYKSVLPLESRGIKIRINNVGIGERTDFGLKRDRGFSRLHWLNGEVSLSGNIKKYLNINRDVLIQEQTIKDLFELLGSILKEQAYYIEAIAEAENKINSSLSLSKTISDVRSKKDIIESNIQILKVKGFKLKDYQEKTKKIQEESEGALPSINIDKNSKTIYILNSDEYEKDEEIIADTKYKIIYRKKGVKSLSQPVIFTDTDEIEINEDYPLFKSRQYGNLFKKIHLLLLVSRNISKTADDMYEFIINNFLKEFKDIKTK